MHALHHGFRRTLRYTQSNLRSGVLPFLRSGRKDRVPFSRREEKKERLIAGYTQSRAFPRGMEPPTCRYPVYSFIPHTFSLYATPCIPGVPRTLPAGFFLRSHIRYTVLSLSVTSFIPPCVLHTFPAIRNPLPLPLSYWTFPVLSRWIPHATRALQRVFPVFHHTLVG